MPSLINKNLTIDEDNAVVALVQNTESKDSEDYFLLIECQSATSRMMYGCYKLQMTQGRGIDRIVINEKDCHALLATKVFNNDILQGKLLRGASWKISTLKLQQLNAQILEASQHLENIPILSPENPGFSWCCSMLHDLKLSNITDTLPKNPEELHEEIKPVFSEPSPKLGTDEPKSKPSKCSLM